MRRITGVLTVVATLTAMACGDGAREDGDAGEAPDDGVPALEAVTLDGDSVALADLRGEVILLNVWATWCVPCRQEAPELEALHQRYDDRGLRVVGVTVDNRGAEQQIRQFIERFGMTYDIWWDADGRVIDEFGAAGVPLTVLLDRDGRVAWRHLGAFTADNAALRAAVRSTL